MVEDITEPLEHAYWNLHATQRKHNAHHLSSIVVEKTARELVGTECLELDESDPPKREICCSRMFRTRLIESDLIVEALATFTSRTAE